MNVEGSDEGVVANFRLLDLFAFSVLIIGFRAQCSEFRVQFFGFKFQVSGFSFLFSGLRVHI